MWDRWTSKGGETPWQWLQKAPSWRLFTCNKAQLGTVRKSSVRWRENTRLAACYTCKISPSATFKFSWLCTTWPQTGHLSYGQVDKIRFIPSVCIDYMLHSRNCFGHWAWNSIQMWFLSWLPTQSMGFSHTIIHVKVCTTGYFFQREK